MSFSHAKLIDDVRKFASYRRTLRELQALPVQSKQDLNIDAGEIRRIAHTAVYGS